MISKPFLFLFVLLTVKGLAQTGIGTTTPHNSAKLDVSSTNKGFLPPRVTLTGASDVTTIPSPAEGLLVYCTGMSNLTAGYYFWNGSAWVGLSGGSFSAGFVERGTDVTLGNLRVRVNATSSVQLQLSSVSGTYSVYGTGHTVFGTNLSGANYSPASPLSITTTPRTIGAGADYSSFTGGATEVWIIRDTSNSICWRITWNVGTHPTFSNNFISIERIL